MCFVLDLGIVLRLLPWAPLQSCSVFLICSTSSASHFNTPLWLLFDGYFSVWSSRAAAVLVTVAFSRISSLPLVTFCSLWTVLLLLQYVRQRKSYTSYWEKSEVKTCQFRCVDYTSPHGKMTVTRQSAVLNRKSMLCWASLLFHTINDSLGYILLVPGIWIDSDERAGSVCTWIYKIMEYELVLTKKVYVKIFLI